MASRLMEWTIIACFPAGIFLLLGAFEIPSFLDPCHAWDDGAGDEASPAMCINRTSSAETKMQAATRLLLFQGTTLLGLIVALVGAARNMRLLVGVGAGLLGVISVPLVLDVSFVFPLGSAVLLAIGLLLHRGPDAAALGASRAGR